MLISPVEFLRHIQQEVEFCLHATSNVSYDSFIEDPVLTRAVVRSLEIIGEATKKMHPDFTASFPLVPWRDMAGMRDRLIHNYFGVDYEIVWLTVREDLLVLQDWVPRLIAAASEMSDDTET
jgi:uncharacterized protein with HEPN domain